MNSLLKCALCSSSLLIVAFTNANADTGIIKFQGSIVESACKINVEMKSNATLEFEALGSPYCKDNETKTTSLKKIESKADLLNNSNESTKRYSSNQKIYQLNITETDQTQLYVFNVDYK